MDARFRKRKRRRIRKRKRKKKTNREEALNEKECIGVWKGPMESILKTKRGAITFSAKKLPHEHNFKRHVIDALLFGGASRIST